MESVVLISMQRIIVILAISIAVLMAVIGLGFVIHPTCDNNCQSRPAYFYWFPIQGTTYNTWYHTTSNGAPIEEPHTGAPSEEHEAPIEEPPIHIVEP